MMIARPEVSKLDTYGEGRALAVASASCSSSVRRARRSLLGKEPEPLRRSRPPMPTPLHLSDEEKDLLLALAAPIDQRLRPEFLAAVAAELSSEARKRRVPSRQCH